MPAQSTSAATAPGKTTAAGVFTAEQATRGFETYKQVCASCHTVSEHSDDNFRFLWNGETIYNLFDVLWTTMPQDNPGTMAPGAVIDVIAYILKLNNAPEGKEALKSDSTSMRAIKIELKNGSPAVRRQPHR